MMYFDAISVVPVCVLGNVQDCLSAVSLPRWVRYTQGRLQLASHCQTVMEFYRSLYPLQANRDFGALSVLKACQWKPGFSVKWAMISYPIVNTCTNYFFYKCMLFRIFIVNFVINLFIVLAMLNSLVSSQFCTVVHLRADYLTNCRCLVSLSD